MLILFLKKILKKNLSLLDLHSIYLLLVLLKKQQQQKTNTSFSNLFVLYLFSFYLLYN